MNETNTKLDLDNIIVDLRAEKEYGAFLENVPHKKIDDMVVTYRCIISEDEKQLRSFLVTNEILDYIKISQEEIHDIAQKNTNRLYPCCLLTLDEMVNDLINFENHTPSFSTEGELSFKSNENEDIYILTNTTDFHAAVNIADKNIMSKIAEHFHDDIVLHPLGMNQVMIFPMKKIYEQNIMFEDIKELNDWQNSNVNEKITLHLHVWNLLSGKIERLTDDYVKRYVETERQAAYYTNQDGHEMEEYTNKTNNIGEIQLKKKSR